MKKDKTNNKKQFKQETVCLWCRKTVKPGEELKHVHTAILPSW